MRPAKAVKQMPIFCLRVFIRLVKPPRPARSRRSIGSSPIGRRNSDVAALAMKRTGSEIDVANFGCLDGSPVPAIGFDEAPRTP